MNRRGATVALVAVALALACGRERRLSTSGGAPRVVSLSPSTTEALFAVGAGASLVGRSRYCDFPPEVAKLPQVGGYVDASLEAILGLSPTLVVGARGPTGRGLVDTLEARGVRTYFPPTESFDEIDAMIRGLAAQVGRAEAGNAVVEAMRARRARIVASLATERRPRVLLVFGLTPVVVAGPKSFPDEMLRLAGAENAVTDGAGYPTLGLERVLALDPDVVVDAVMGESHAPARIGADAAGWRELRAVREGRVLALGDESMLRPGPRVLDGVVTLARALHPGTSSP